MCNLKYTYSHTHACTQTAHRTKKIRIVLSLRWGNFLVQSLSKPEFEQKGLKGHKSVLDLILILHKSKWIKNP